MTSTIGTENWRIEACRNLARRHDKDASRVRIKVIPAQINQDQSNDHRFTARITRQIIDRDREVVLPSGILLRDYQVSGAIHWSHDFDRPIGIGGHVKRVGDALVAEGEFLRRPADYKGDFFPDFARAFVTQMVAAGKNPGVSIGFEILDSRRATPKDKKDFGEQVEIVTTKANLLEWSIATVPANPQAFVTSVGKSLDRPTLKALFPNISLGTDEPGNTHAETPTRKSVYLLPLRRPGGRTSQDRPLNADSIAMLVKQSIARKRGDLYV